jgi:hypothetical protein
MTSKKVGYSERCVEGDSTAMGSVAAYGVSWRVVLEQVSSNAAL